MEPHHLTLAEASALLAAGKLSSVELTQAILQRITATDPYLGAYVTVSAEAALKQAKAADERRAKNDRVGPLLGVPFSLKDAIVSRGVRTTASSRILSQYVPPYNATVAARLDTAGAVLLGKTNMDEFGMGSSCENSAVCPGRNPWDLARVPGGSSGGSGAAVAAGLGYYSLGGDTGGSIRMPAAFCNLVGLKPTYGRVSRYGLIALCSSFDTIGPLTRTVRDNALVLQTIAGHDPHDMTTRKEPVPDYLAKLGKSIKGMRLGMPAEYFGKGLDPDVEKVVRAAIAELEKLGAKTVPVSLPTTKYAIPIYYLCLFAEASANLARYDGIRFGSAVPKDPKSIHDTYFQSRGAGFGPEVKRRIMLGTYVLSAGYYDAYYLKAQKARTLQRRDFEKALSQCDALVGPVSPTVAFKLGEKTDDPLAMYLSDIYTTPINPAGIPAVTVPCGFSQGLPVGLQLIGRHLDEETLFQIGDAYQRETDWHTHRPPEIPAGTKQVVRAF
jgi:aspartyl-tRNA(Asn)/glutamyl-tRNA(Gln) amidotransferase subunit A